MIPTEHPTLAQLWSAAHVCDPCGRAWGSPPPHPEAVTYWHSTCHLCGLELGVSHVRNYGYLRRGAGAGGGQGQAESTHHHRHTMTTDYRALCAELLQELEHASAWDYQHALKDQARAALAQPVPPADGEVIELVALIRQIALAWEPDACLLGNMTAGQLARAAVLLERLAQPEPVGPTDEDLLFWASYYGIDYVDVDHPSELDAEKAPVRSDELRIFARAVLQRWGRPTLTPIPVTERLPGAEDCDAEGTCWMWHPVNFHYCLCLPDPSVHTHWLPAHALPLPTTEANP